MVRPINPQLGGSISGSSSPPVRELLLITGHVTVIYIAPLLERTSGRAFGHGRHVLLPEAAGGGDAWRRCQTELWVMFRS